jgi:hypothetical protein
VRRAKCLKILVPPWPPSLPPSHPPPRRPRRRLCHRPHYPAGAERWLSGGGPRACPANGPQSAHPTQLALYFRRASLSLSLALAGQDEIVSAGRSDRLPVAVRVGGPRGPTSPPRLAGVSEGGGGTRRKLDLEGLDSRALAVGLLPRANLDCTRCGPSSGPLEARCLLDFPTGRVLSAEPRGAFVWVADAGRDEASTLPRERIGPR